MDQPPPIPDRKSHPFHTYEMIYEIPQAIQQTTEQVREARASIEELKEKTRIYFTGCGTAFFSSMLGSQVLSLSDDERRISCVPALELQSYDYPFGKDCAVIGISHSGITKTTTDALQHAKDKKAFTIGITHFENRPISKVADTTLVIGNSPDNSRCHTKCYLTGAVACTQLAIELLHSQGDLPNRLKQIESELNKLPDLTKRVVTSTDDSCKRMAQKYEDMNDYYFSGTGPNVPNTMEAALKIMETSFVPAQGFETEQLLHGPWVSMDKESLLTIFAPKGPCHSRSVDLAKAAKTFGTSVIGLTEEGDQELVSVCDEVVKLPSVDEYVSPFLNIIPAYLFAYYASIGRGNNPDMLRYTAAEYWQGRTIIFPPGTH
jgi:glucosamine--fructose-6-phosphate aminotransferase (isomerizing)